MEKNSVRYPLTDTANGLCASLGIQITLQEEGLVKATMPVDHRTCQSFGILHGGASLALAETVAGYGSKLLCPADCVPCGIQVSGNHLRMVPQGTEVEATGQLLFKGRTQHVWSVDVTTPNGSLVSTSRVVNMIVKRQS